MIKAYILTLFLCPVADGEPVWKKCARLPGAPVASVHLSKAECYDEARRHNKTVAKMDDKYYLTTGCIPSKIRSS